MSKHKVKSHRWHAGHLRITEAEFDSLEEAMAYANTRFGSDSVKVYNADDELIHANQSSTTDSTYA